MNQNRPLTRRAVLRRLALLGIGTTTATAHAAVECVARAGASTGEGDVVTKVSTFAGVDDKKSPDAAIADAIADAARRPAGIVDFEGITYVTTRTVTISEVGVTLANGGICPTGQFPALLVQAANVTVRDMLFSRSTDSSPLAPTPDRCCVVVSGERFQSYDCHYLGANASCLYLANGRCNGTIIRGGEMTTGGSARQNGSAVFAASGPEGHRDLTIDGIYIHDTTMGVSLFDTSGSSVINCRVERVRALPTVALSGWLNVAGNVWRTRSAAGTPSVDGIASDREAGATNVVTVDGKQLGGVFSGSSPGLNGASQSGGYLYLNLGGADPNTKNISSGIVSGYAFMVYTSESFCEFNRFEGNYAKDCDGFGIYFQLGLNGTGTGGNQAVGNNLVNVCLAGRQFRSLPFAAIGIVGGNDTLLVSNMIDGVGSVADKAPGVHVVPSNLHPNSSNGRIVGTSVRNGSQHGFCISSSNWSLNDCHALRNANDGFLVITAANGGVLTNVLLTNCVASNNGGEGFAVNGSNPTIGHVSAQIVNGESRENALSGLVFIGSAAHTVRDSGVVGMQLRSNAAAHPGRPQIWVRSGCLRTTVKNCSMVPAAPGSVGLLIEDGAVDTRVASNKYG